MIAIVTYVGVGLGALLAAWGFFHQLIVGAAVTLVKDLEDNSARLLVMSWVAQGAFMTFLGLLPAALLLLYGPLVPAVGAVLFLCAMALLFLSGHVLVTGYATHIKPIRIGALIEFVYGIYLLTVLILL
ncbi:MAG: hypothetical protein HS115_12845 [Spirochaetales bacterium]|nr:hypothetical protein [Spirochaetales bacterium]